ncbi:type II toxin-antitoxin system VapC family toxin [uncultured Thiodictyon sp.]|uniref:type II toxin-antitoxin system VapC family toxin n=1 Tax=uncultured Thiodictyon sp. TaxID=1846217 RepID=UPI0025DE7492|nr:type II toxin-antitoxin system VapC family toxin [uncultured Thiodictyon sp.]
MRLLLDTHALLWWFTADARLSVRAQAAIADEANTIHVSAASAWDIATKQRIGKLDEVPKAAERFAELVAADGFLHLPVSYLHGLRTGGYALAHRDPFDRMLAAQSELESMVLVTRDPAFSAFPVATLW